MTLLRQANWHWGLHCLAALGEHLATTFRQPQGVDAAGAGDLRDEAGGAGLAALQIGNGGLGHAYRLGKLDLAEMGVLARRLDAIFEFHRWKD